MIETTLNIDKDVVKEIYDAAVVLNWSRSEVIVKLLKIVMERDVDKHKVVRAVKYQKSTDNSSWHRFHICLRFDDYEFFLDLRKFLKFSVSYLVAHAVKKYLKELLDENFTDNYHFKYYTKTTEIKDGLRYWQIIWGKQKKEGENKQE